MRHGAPVPVERHWTTTGAEASLDDTTEMDKMDFKNMRVSTRLTWAFAAVLLVSMVSAGLALNKLSGIQDNLRDIGRRYVDVVDRAYCVDYLESWAKRNSV